MWWVAETHVGDIVSYMHALSSLDSVGIGCVVVLERPLLSSRGRPLAAVHDNPLISCLHTQLRHGVIELLGL